MKSAERQHKGFSCCIQVGQQHRIVAEHCHTVLLTTPFWTAPDGGMLLPLCARQRKARLLLPGRALADIHRGSRQHAAVTAELSGSRTAETLNPDLQELSLSAASECPPVPDVRHLAVHSSCDEQSAQTWLRHIAARLTWTVTGEALTSVKKERLAQLAHGQKCATRRHRPTTPSPVTTRCRVLVEALLQHLMSFVSPVSG